MAVDALEHLLGHSRSAQISLMGVRRWANHVAQVCRSTWGTTSGPHRRSTARRKPLLIFLTVRRSIRPRLVWLCRAGAAGGYAPATAADPDCGRALLFLRGADSLTMKASAFEIDPAAADGLRERRIANRSRPRTGVKANQDEAGDVLQCMAGRRAELFLAMPISGPKRASGFDGVSHANVRCHASAAIPGSGRCTAPGADDPMAERRSSSSRRAASLPNLPYYLCFTHINKLAAHGYSFKEGPRFMLDGMTYGGTRNPALKSDAERALEQRPYFPRPLHSLQEDRDKKFNQTLTTCDLDKVAHAHLAKRRRTLPGGKPT